MTHTGIAIVWPAWFLGSTDSSLHVTALFLGDTETTTFDRDAIQAVLEEAPLAPGPVRVTGLALFGKENNIPVLTVKNIAMSKAQEWIVRELDLLGITSPSDFPFNPHVTIAKETAKTYFPGYVQLEAPVLWWGDSRPIHSKHGKTKVEVTA